jgi:sugar/nucleoside kinase (ribokinase family)
MVENRNRIVIVGVSSIDYIIPVSSYPVEDSKSLCDTVTRQCGGVSFNIAVNLKLLGMPVDLISWVGDDLLGRTIIENLRTADIDTSGVNVINDSTLECFTITSGMSSTRTCLFTTPKPPPFLSAKQIDLLKNCNIVYYDGAWSSALPTLNQLAVDNKILFIANHEHFLPGLVHSSLKEASVLIASEQGLLNRASVNNDEVLRALQEIWTKRRKLVGATLGSKGSLFYDGGREIFTPSFPITNKNSTGSGDAFHAGFIKGLYLGWELTDILSYATACGAVKCTLNASNFLSDELAFTEELIEAFLT